jgi:hypothetical protein
LGIGFRQRKVVFSSLQISTEAHAVVLLPCD